MAMFKFNAEQKKKISTAVKNAEAKTSGEIATAFIKESYDYAIYELLFAVVVGFIYFTVLMFFSDSIANSLQNMFWDYNINYLLIFFGFSTFLVIAIAYFVANISYVDRLIVSQKVKQKKVEERALQHFMQSGVSYTRDRTGILIFISYLEKRVVLLADTAINEKIEQHEWQKIVDHITAGIKNNQLAENLVDAIEDCGELLQKHFPIKEDDTNELDNEIEILE
jgi:putative membrane protein